MITTYVECWYCHEMYQPSERYCPVCRHKPKDESGRHTQPAALVKLPIIYPQMPTKFTVRINRGKGECETLHLDCVGESTTHYHGVKKHTSTGFAVDEWFAKSSTLVNSF